MAELSRFKVAVLATDGFEESELTEPVRALREAGAQVEIVSPEKGEIQAFRHHDKSIRVPVNHTLEEVGAEDYDGLLLPGGALNADQLRSESKVQSWIQSFDQSKKPIAFICHAPWSLVSAGVVKGRTLTSYFTITDDIRNAGGNWVDEEVVRDENWVSSRSPKDLPAFNREMIRLFQESRKQKAA